MSEDLTALAADAYVYGFPLVTNLREVKKFTRDGLGSLPPAPFNGFSHATALAGPAERFVSVNNDTVYSIAQADLSGGPLLLSVPGRHRAVSPRPPQKCPMAWTSTNGCGAG
ncbi:MAG: DUF1254 domain-containing protein, partial [Trebonia sp.]